MRLRISPLISKSGAFEIRDHADQAERSVGLPFRVVAEKACGSRDLSPRLERGSDAFGQRGSEIIIQRNHPAPAGNFGIRDCICIALRGKNRALARRIEHNPERRVQPRASQLDEPSVGIEPGETGGAGIGGAAALGRIYTGPDVAGNGHGWGRGIPGHVFAFAPGDHGDISTASETADRDGRETGGFSSRQRLPVIAGAVNPSDHRHVSAACGLDQRSCRCSTVPHRRAARLPRSRPGNRWACRARHRARTVRASARTPVARAHRNPHSFRAGRVSSGPLGHRIGTAFPKFSSTIASPFAGLDHRCPAHIGPQRNRHGGTGDAGLFIRS